MGKRRNSAAKLVARGGRTASQRGPLRGTAMSDHGVIARFVGKYVSDGQIVESSDPDKVAYYPGKGVQLTLIEFPLSEAKAYAKINDPSGAQWGGARALERAIFRVEGESLVAENIELAPGSLLKEKLVMNEDASMSHLLEFSDAQHGQWICKPK